MTDERKGFKESPFSEAVRAWTPEELARIDGKQATGMEFTVDQDRIYFRIQYEGGVVGKYEDAEVSPTDAEGLVRKRQELSRRYRIPGENQY